MAKYITRLKALISFLFRRKTEKADFDLNYLLLSAQTALLSEVVPQIRAVSIDFDETKNEIILHFYYDCEVDDKLFDLASCVSAEIETNPEYPFFCSLNEDIALSLPLPQEIPNQGNLIYLRKEPSFPKFTKKMNSERLKTETPIVALLLVTQEALLGKVTPALQRVSVDINDEEKGLYFYFEYDSPISDEDRNLADCVVKEASASFPEYSSHCNIFPVGSDNPMGKRSAYARWESNKE
jgi:hypothetical protein